MSPRLSTAFCNYYGITPHRYRNPSDSSAGRLGGIEKEKQKGYKNSSDSSAGRMGANQTNSRFAANYAAEKTNDEPLTEYESQYVEVHDEKVNRNDHVEALIDYYLGLTQEEETHSKVHIKNLFPISIYKLEMNYRNLYLSLLQDQNNISNGTPRISNQTNRRERMEFKL